MIVTKISYGETVQSKPYESERLDLEVVPADGQSYDDAVAECRAFVRHKLRGEPLPLARQPADHTPPACSAPAPGLVPLVTGSAPPVPAINCWTTVVETDPPFDAPSADPGVAARLPKGYGQFTSQQWIAWLEGNKVTIPQFEKALQAAVENKTKSMDVWEACMKAFGARLRDHAAPEWTETIVRMLHAERKYIDDIRAAERQTAAA